MLENPVSLVIRMEHMWDDCIHWGVYLSVLYLSSIVLDKVITQTPTPPDPRKNRDAIKQVLHFNSHSALPSLYSALI